MKKVTVVIPNFNGMKYLEECLGSLRRQTGGSFETIVVDNGSSDGSLVFLREYFPEVQVISLPENMGFCRAVNEGIRAAKTPYVLLLNNDVQAEPDFVRELTEAIQRHPKAFSCGAKMLQYHRRNLVDDAGNYYNALGWAFARGKDRPKEEYETEDSIFAACAGAAIYRRKVFEVIGRLTRSILPIWRTRISGTAPDCTGMRTGSRPKRWSTMWEAAPQVPGTMSSRPGILPEIMSICFIKICRCRRSF